MKNYKVIATREFKDATEIDEKTGLKVIRKVNDEFYCTKERYEFLKANNAVKLVEIIEGIKIIPKKTEPIKFVEKEITEEEVQAVASAIVEETQEQDKTIEEVVNEIVDEVVESKEINDIIDNVVDEVVEEVVKPKPKKKKHNKK
jgi:hypothetical protein